MKTWFSIIAVTATAIAAAAAAGQAAPPSEVSIYDEIGAWGITAKDYLDAFSKLPPGDVIVNINSPGGSVADALAMMNGMRASGRNITTRVMGVAASAASLVAQAGNRREMPDNTLMMLHAPSTITYGNAADHRESAAVLDTFESVLRGVYAKRTGAEPEKVATWLAKDTWLTADEAKALGLIDTVTPSVAISARYEADRPDLPAAIRAALAKPPAPPAPAPAPGPAPAPAPAANGRPFTEIVQLELKAAGLEAHAGAFALDPKITSVEALTTAIGEAREIVALCAVLGKPEIGVAAIDKRMPLAELRAELVKAKTDADKDKRVVPGPAPAPAPAAKGIHITNEWDEIRKVNDAAIKARSTPSAA